MPKLETITVEGFKSIASIEKLPLRPINVLIGSNGSGKSNFIEVFSFLHAIRQGHLQEYVASAGGADQVLHFGPKVTKFLGIEVSFGGGLEYAISLRPTARDRLCPSVEAVYFWDEQPHREEALVPSEFEAGLSQAQFSKAADQVRNLLDSWRVYHFHDTSPTSPMKLTASLADNEFLRPDASNLAPFLYYLQKKHPTAYSLIRRTVSLVAPFFDDFRLRPQKLNRNTIRLEWRHKGRETNFDVSALSDGTLRFIALATLFLQPEAERPSIILVDEPELGLHPRAIALLASLIRSASQKTQVVISTQSTLLLDQFDPEDVLVADRVQGATQLTRLDPKELAAWLRRYTLADLWLKNEIGGRPGPERTNGETARSR